jgi:hypothetical protein
MLIKMRFDNFAQGVGIDCIKLNRNLTEIFRSAVG